MVRGPDLSQNLAASIAELHIRQLHSSRGDPALVHGMGLAPTGFSKYCIGVALLFPQIKHNNFKPKLRLLQQLMGDTLHNA